MGHAAITPKLRDMAINQVKIENFEYNRQNSKHIEVSMGEVANYGERESFSVNL